MDRHVALVTGPDNPLELGAFGLPRMNRDGAGSARTPAPACQTVASAERYALSQFVNAAGRRATEARSHPGPRGPCPVRMIQALEFRTGHGFDLLADLAGGRLTPRERSGKDDHARS